MQTEPWPWLSDEGRISAKLATQWGDTSTRNVLSRAFAHLSDMAAQTRNPQRAAELLCVAYAYHGAGTSGEWVARYDAGVSRAMVEQCDERAARLGFPMQVAALLDHLPKAG